MGVAPGRVWVGSCLRQVTSVQILVGYFASHGRVEVGYARGHAQGGLGRAQACRVGFVKVLDNS